MEEYDQRSRIGMLFGSLDLRQLTLLNDRVEMHTGIFAYSRLYLICQVGIMTVAVVTVMWMFSQAIPRSDGIF